jgi:type IV pilus assembly protein PilY1
MKSQRNRSVSLVFGLAITVMSLAGALPASADDTEIFIGATTGGVKPNILFVLDTSGSMETEVVTENAPYDPSVTYAGTCNSSYVYWVRDSGTPFYPPTCATDNYFNLSALTCKPALTALAAGGAGLYAADRAAQYDTTDTRWEQIRYYEKTKYVECRADAGTHGQTDAATAKYATDSSNIRWTTSSTAQITWSANNTDRNYVFYSANYSTGGTTPSTSRLRRASRSSRA